MLKIQKKNKSEAQIPSSLMSCQQAVQKGWAQASPPPPDPNSKLHNFWQQLLTVRLQGNVMSPSGFVPDKNPGFTLEGGDSSP